MVTVAAVPVKDLANAKQRLLPLLSAKERQRLVQAMIEDVLITLSRAPLGEVIVVTRDPTVIELAREFSATILVEPENLGQTEAVALAQRRAVAVGADAFLTIPGDVPLATLEEIAAVLGAAGMTPAAVFVPSRSGLGTNAALLAPPNLMPLTFGEPSFANHLAAARRRGITPLTLSLPGLGLDIDDPEDLRSAAESGRPTRTTAALTALDVLSRPG